MPSVLAIVSKAIFEKEARGVGEGDVVPLDRYVSKNKGIAPVGEGGGLFLVTVRPPDERLWLVAVLEAPKFDGESWKAAKNVVPIRDITDVKDKIKFTSGTGISAKKGALGMSLQTPRVLTGGDVALLRGGAGAPVATGIHLNAHEPRGPAPCLCKRCLSIAPEEVTIGSLELVRERAEGNGRFLWFWMPKSLDGDRQALRRAVASKLHAKGNAVSATRKGNLDTVFGGGDQGDDDE
jgi:hypothetical protein